MALVSPKTIIISTMGAKRPFSGQLSSVVSVAEDNAMMEGAPRKRRRLTNLTPDERLMRRKLKNRVAAQTARDRKKQHMTELEEALAEMEAENKRLQAENSTLKQQTGILSQENSCLRGQLGFSKDTPMVGVESSVKKPGSPGSAAGTDPGSLQGSHPNLDSAVDAESDILMGLLEEIRDSVKSPEGVENVASLESEAGAICPDFYIEEAADEPHHKVVGPTAAELESIKELIQFDHEYYNKSSAQSSPVTSEEDKTVVTPLNSATEESEDDAPLPTSEIPRLPRKGKSGSAPAMVSVVKPDLQKMLPEIYRSTSAVPKQQQQLVQLDAVKAEPVSEGGASVSSASSSLCLSEIDMSTLTDTLEQLIDLDSLLQGGTNDNDDKEFCFPSLVTGDNPTCIDSFNAEGKPVTQPHVHSSVSFSSLLKNALNPISNGSVSSGIKSKATTVDVKPEGRDKVQSSQEGLAPAGLAMNPVGSASFSDDDPFDLLNAAFGGESGYGSGRSEAGSPRSDSSSLLDDSDQLWQESFTELFPSLI